MGWWKDRLTYAPEDDRTKMPEAIEVVEPGETLSRPVKVTMVSDNRGTFGKARDAHAALARAYGDALEAGMKPEGLVKYMNALERAYRELNNNRRCEERLTRLLEIAISERGGGR